MHFLVNSFLLFIVLSLFINLRALGIDETCQVCKSNDDCVAKANMKLALEGEDTFWFKNNQPIANKNQGIHHPKYYNYLIDCNEFFTILKPNSTDSGKSIYKSKNKKRDTNCTEFNLYIYGINLHKLTFIYFKTLF